MMALPTYSRICLVSFSLAAGVFALSIVESRPCTGTTSSRTGAVLTGRSFLGFLACWLGSRGPFENGGLFLFFSFRFLLSCSLIPSCVGLRCWDQFGPLSELLSLLDLLGIPKVYRGLNLGKLGLLLRGACCFNLERPSALNLDLNLRSFFRRPSLLQVCMHVYTLDRALRLHSMSCLR